MINSILVRLIQFYGEPSEPAYVRVNGKLYETKQIKLEYFDDENGNSGNALIIEVEE